MAVQFIDGRAADAAPLQSFFSRMYHPGYVLAGSEPFLQWQFASVPSGDRNGLDIKLALVDGAIAGCIGYIPVELTVCGTQVRAAWAANWMVDDHYRRLGLGPLLMRDLCRQFDVTLALGGNPDAHALLPRMGWTDFGDLQRYVGVLDPQQAAPLGDVRGVPPVAFDDRGGAIRVDAIHDDATALWDRIGRGLVGTRRSAEYLRWRYAAHPLFHYRLFELRRDGALAGIAVYRLEHVRDLPVTVGRIVELIAAPEDAAGLLHGMARDAAAEGAAIIDFFCSRPSLRPPLEAAGFSAGLSHRVPMLFQPIDRTRSGVLFMADVRKCAAAANQVEWYVTTSDGDQDRPN